MTKRTQSALCFQHKPRQTNPIRETRPRTAHRPAALPGRPAGWTRARPHPDPGRAGRRTLHPQAKRPARADRRRRARVRARSSTARPSRAGKATPKYWRVENGSLVGEITPETVVRSNTFIVWRGGRPRDFELKLDYRITAEGNSGINYRSEIIPDPVTPANQFAMRGYQCDLDGKKRYPGNNYEEKGRLFLAVRGQVSHVVGGAQADRPVDLRRLRTSWPPT